jgi:hypothetical protein
VAFEWTGQAPVAERPAPVPASKVSLQVRKPKPGHAGH